ncbi:WecB/TagA/CpsF family glycosyltransferase [Microbacterium gubbeenense]|uniref:WecB/TagA/CpsF family glycosyltransferase n=1 Tax=Microbacterium gubbeenense TaxID=159896 RepID=UPI0012FBD7BF|nr:WecB/TagA/CpsF family glycosyltransferase [Microbacterium gubbeenense]
MTRQYRQPVEGPIFHLIDGQLAFMGKPLFGANMQLLLDKLQELSSQSRPALVITLNVDQALNLEHDWNFRAVFESADLVVIDGTPISWLGKVLGATEVSRNTGADLLPACASVGKERGWRIGVTGGSTEVSQLATNNLADKFGADLCSVPFPMISAPDDSASQPVVEALKKIAPDIVFLCLGSPKQELWFGSWHSQLPPAVYIGAGAAADFSAGVMTRAPVFMQRLGLEWLFRLAHEPRRLAHRYLIRGPRFLLLACRSVGHSLARRSHARKNWSRIKDFNEGGHA